MKKTVKQLDNFDAISLRNRIEIEELKETNRLISIRNNEIRQMLQRQLKWVKL